MSICPRCYNEIGLNAIWKDDPLFTSNGEAGVNYTGLMQLKVTHIIALQDRCKKLEAEWLSLANRTTWTVITDTTTTHDLFMNIDRIIKELRKSIEKILIASGTTKYQYFNYDINGVNQMHGQTDWHDICDLTAPFVQKMTDYQVKAIHIEDLRKPYIGSLMERFNKSDVGNIVTYPNPSFPDSMSPGYSYGDIGDKPTVNVYDRPWALALWNPASFFPYNDGYNTWYQLPPDMSGFKYWQIVNHASGGSGYFNASMQSIATILQDPLTNNKSLSIISSVNSHSQNNIMDALPDGFVGDPLDLTAWQGQAVARTAGAIPGMITLDVPLFTATGTWKTRPVVTDSNQFTADLNCIWSTSNVLIGASGSTPAINYTEYPTIRILITLTTGSEPTSHSGSVLYQIILGESSVYYGNIFVPGKVTHSMGGVIVGIDVSKRLTLTDISSTLTVDLWNEVCQAVLSDYHEMVWDPVTHTYVIKYDAFGHMIPTMKYVAEFEITAYLRELQAGVSGAGTQPDPVASATGGAVSVNLDNIGLIKL
jgi:hypothetical protein